MNKVGVSIIKGSMFHGLEGEFIQRVKKYLLKGDYSEAIDIFEIDDISMVSKIVYGNKLYSLLLLINGDVFITRESIMRLLRIADKNKFSIIVPVSNESKLLHQKQIPSFSYQTISVFRWAVDEIYERYGDKVIEVDEIDDFCIAIKRDVFDSLQDDIQSICISKAVKDRGGRLAVAKGIYVHRYGNCYESAREDLLRFVPLGAMDILDIGCANGILGEILKKRQKCVVTGVDIDAKAVDIARNKLDIVIHGDIEEIINGGFLCEYDCIICGDVLEHMKDPWRVVGSLKNHLRKGGYFIASVPNIVNWAVIYEMLHARWDYVPFSILSGTHIRFFTKMTLKELFEENGYKVQEILFQYLDIPNKAAIFMTTLKDLFPEIDEEEIKASEIIIIAKNI